MSNFVLKNSIKNFDRRFHQWLSIAADTSINKNIIVDFSKLDYIEPEASVGILTKISLLQNEGYNFTIIEPSKQNISKLLYSSNFMYHCNPSIYQKNNRKILRYNMPIFSFRNHDELFVAVNDTMKCVIQCIEELNRDQMAALEWSLNEVAENVLSHSESTIGGFLQVVSFPTKQKFGLYVSDGGIGIVESMKRTFTDSDISLLNMCVQEGVTSKKATNQGNGLYGTLQCCKVGLGNLSIYTNKGTFIYESKSKSTRSFIDKIEITGTIVSALINYKVEELISRALIFKGIRHEPNDYIDITYIDNEDKLCIRVSESVTHYGTRHSGMRLRNEIMMISERLNKEIIIDLMDVTIMSSSFADEAFGRLFQDSELVDKAKNIKLKNVSEDNRNIIARAIQIRSEQFSI